MDLLVSLLTSPWPWYVSGPLIGAMVPLLLYFGNRSFGVSSNLRHICAMSRPDCVKVDFFTYNWRESSWNLVYAVGIVMGGFLAAVTFADPAPINLSEGARELFAEWGLSTPQGLLPPELFGFSASNMALMLGAGVLIGFGTRYAAGCTSGHAITGLATLQVESLVAVIGIFAGGLFASHFLLGLVL
jgi:uncharacterized membrane protein YedE/YeeE